MAEEDGLRNLQDVLYAQKKMLENLLASEGWAIIEQSLETTVKVKRAEDFQTPINSTEAAFASATLRGAVAGIQTAISWPKTLIADIIVDIDKLTTEIEEAQDG